MWNLSLEWHAIRQRHGIRQGRVAYAVGGVDVGAKLSDKDVREAVGELAGKVASEAVDRCAAGNVAGVDVRAASEQEDHRLE